MRKVILLLGLVLQVIIVDAQSVSGSLVDEKGNPVSFANVVLLSSKDSSFVQGTISNEQGIFSIDQTSGNNILRISCLGFIPMTKAYAQFPVTIVMHEDVNLLGEVVVKGNRPSYKLTAEGLQTHVQGTVLSKMGTAEDVLKHIPGLQKKNDAYEVFGKGSPIIYVNGRLLRDLSELDQLKSEDIKNVELITSPGARYDASVKAVDFNADYLFDKNGDNTIQREESSNKEDRVVTSTNTLRSELFAAKLVLSRPLLGGNVMIGAEYSHTERQDDYVNPEGYVPTSFSELKEQNISPFLEYSRNTPIGQLSVGGRYEWVNFNYYEDGKYMEGQSRNFSNFFPSVSLGSEIGGVQLQLSYAAKTRRPSYQQLSNNVTYANRFTLQSGNPLLEHEVVHNVSLMGAWKFMQFSVDYNDRRNAIIYWGEQMEYNPAVTLISFKNLHSLKSVSAFLSLAPKFGIWSPQLNWGVQKQWLDLETTDGLLKMNKPMFTGAFNNTFNFNHGWMASVEMNYQSKGDMENCSETKNIFYVDAGVTKFFWGDRMSVKLSGTDLFHGMKSGNRMYYNRASSLQINNYDSRKVMLTVRYKFNATRNKYKGSGAGESEKERL